jgi:MFS family permease
MFAWLFGSGSTPPAFLRFRSSRTFIIITVSSAVFTDIFAYGIVVPVFPFALTERASIDEDDVQRWISIFLAVYGAALLVASPVFGWLADRNQSRQVPFLLGLVALGISTAMLCVGNSIAIFAAGRVLQGISAAVVWIAGLALLVDTVGPEGVGTAMGYVGLSMSLAILLAPLLGGVVFETAGYYSVYAMVFGLIVLDIILRFAMIEPRNARKWLVEDPSVSESDSLEKSAIKEPGVSAEVTRIQNDTASPSPEKGHLDNQESTERTASNTPSNAAEAAAASNMPAPIRTIVSRLPPVVFLFGSRRILAALWACTMQASLLTSFDAILPLFVRDMFRWNAIGAGLIFLPIVVASFGGPIVGSLSDKYGPRWFATAGFVLSCPFLILLRLVDNDSINHKVMLCAFLVVIGAGLTLAIIPLMAEMTYAVEAKALRSPPGFFGKNGAYAQAYGLFNMAWAAGSMIGPLLAGFVRDAYGWPTATLILGCVSIFTAFPTAVWTGGSIFKKRRKDAEESRNSASPSEGDVA